MGWGFRSIIWIVIGVVAVSCGKSSNSFVLLPPSVTDDFNMCSKLDFSTVSWSNAMKLNEQKAFMLALNISGSYEGNADWSNLADGFDGQGLSLGLLNQNFGQGTLQPLIIKMRNQHLKVLKKIFTKAHLTSLLEMIADWEKSDNLTKADTFEEPLMSTFDLYPLLTDENLRSVEWAQTHIYYGDKIKSDWYKEFIAMAESPEYISIQVDEALKLHSKAVNYVAKMNVPEVRAYLLAFDFVNQNGGIHDRDIQDYSEYVKKNPFISNTDKLLKILELHLRSVTSQFIPDVRSRKTVIINGKGLVHGATRNLEGEYCFNRFSAILIDPNRIFKILGHSFLFSVMNY